MFVLNPNVARVTWMSRGDVMRVRTRLSLVRFAIYTHHNGAIRLRPPPGARINSFEIMQLLNGMVHALIWTQISGR
jgi:hypothetical protein